MFSLMTKTGGRSFPLKKFYRSGEQFDPKSFEPGLRIVTPKTLGDSHFLIFQNRGFSDFSQGLNVNICAVNRK